VLNIIGKRWSRWIGIYKKPTRQYLTMKGLNKVLLLGNLGKDPEVQTLMSISGTLHGGVAIFLGFLNGALLFFFSIRCSRFCGSCKGRTS
jgi:hypothetical protein